jgi:polyisoprenoid-binding protein YceI
MYNLTQMKRKSGALVLFCLVFLACKNDLKIESAPVAQKTAIPTAAPVPPDGSAAFTLTEGTVNWVSTNSIGNGKHQGSISVEGGKVWVKQDQLLYGNVILDMNSVSATDVKDPSSRLKLETHLKNADFFEANVFPKAEFMFIEASPSSMPNTNWVLSGTLTMKGITAPVSVPLKVSIEGDILRAESPIFAINRTTWGVNFHSGILGTAKDEMVDDAVSIKLRVVAKKH